MGMSKPILYSYFRSSASYRVRIALHLKDIDFEYQPVHLLKDGGQQYNKDYLRLNPMGQVPCFVHNNQSLGQSMAIIDYVDQRWPHPRLFPLDPWERSQVIEICELMNSGIQPLQNLGVSKKLKCQFNAQGKDVNQWNHFWISKGLEAIEKKLQSTAGRFSLGGQLSAVDAFIVPQVFSSTRFGVNVDHYPTVSRVNKNCMELAEFQKAAPDQQPDTPTTTTPLTRISHKLP